MGLEEEPEDLTLRPLAVEPELGPGAVVGIDQGPGRMVVAHKGLVVVRLGVEVVQHPAKE